MSPLLATDVAPLTLPAEPRCYALVVGINRYDDPQIPDLSFAVADARAVSAALARDGACRVQTLSERVTRDEVQAELDELKSLMSDEDTLVLYLALHGRKVTQQGTPLQLLASDSRRDDLSVGTFTLEELEGEVGQIPAAARVVILDACRSVWTEEEGRRDGALDLAPALAAPGFEDVWLFATADGSPSREDPQLGHGHYTAALLEGLDGPADQDGDGRITVSEAHAFAQRAMQREGVDQAPELRLNTNHPEIGQTVLAFVPSAPADLVPLLRVQASLGPSFSPEAWTRALNPEIDSSLSVGGLEPDWPLPTQLGLQLWVTPGPDPSRWRAGLRTSAGVGARSVSGDTLLCLGALTGTAGARVRGGASLGAGGSWQREGGGSFGSPAAELGVDGTLRMGPLTLTVGAGWRVNRVQVLVINDLGLPEDNAVEFGLYHRPTLSAQVGASRPLGTRPPTLP